MEAVTEKITAVDQVAKAFQDNRDAVLRSLLNVSAFLTSVTLAMFLLLASSLDFVQGGGILFLILINAVQWFFALYRAIPYRVRAIFFILTILASNVLVLFSTGLSSTTRILFLYFIVMTFLLLSSRAGIIALAGTCLAMGVVGYLVATGRFVPEGDISLSGLIINFNLIFLIIVYATYRLKVLANQQSEEQQRVAHQLAYQRANLEGIVERRTHALSTASTISRKLLTIYDQRELLTTVVSSLSDAFNYYHTHIYMLDEASSTLKMSAGSGDVGMALFAIGHDIPIGKGLVGQAALMNISIFVPDVSQDNNWLPNPLLPETKSEIVVPVTFGDKVLGVLDVQDDAVGGLMQEDVNVLETVALQLGVALRNAQIYQKARLRAGRNSTANNIAKRIRQARDVDQTLKVAVEGLGQYMTDGVASGRADLGQLSNKPSRQAEGGRA